MIDSGNRSKNPQELPEPTGRSIAILLLVVLWTGWPISGPAQAGSQPGASSAGQREKSGAAPVSETAPGADARLWFSPPRLRFCGKPVERTEIEVFWDASAMGVERAQILIDNIDGPKFAAGDAVGSARTGEWVTNGKRFLLYLPELDRVVAEKAFQLLPCNTAEYPFKQQ